MFHILPILIVFFLDCSYFLVDALAVHVVKYAVTVIAENGTGVEVRHTDRQQERYVTVALDGSVGISAIETGSIVACLLLISAQHA